MLSEVQACQARINSLESELAVAAADNSTRLAEQQKSFIAKLEQLRQVHSQQLTAATQASQVRCSQAVAAPACLALATLFCLVVSIKLTS